MAERDRYEWERGRDYVDYGDRDRRSYGAGERWIGSDDWRSRANSTRVRSEHGWNEPHRSTDWSRGRYQPRSSDERNWYERGEAQTYGLGAPNWSGAPRREPQEFGRGFSSDAQRFSNRQFGHWEDWGGHGADYGASAWSSRGASFAGRGPRNYRRSDERVREDVNERLTADPRVDAWDIEVRVQNGEVTLTGIVADRHTRRLAEEIVEDLPGVRDIKNDLRVGPGMFSSGQESLEQGRTRDEGALGRTGDPQKREEVTTLNQSGKINR